MRCQLDRRGIYSAIDGDADTTYSARANLTLYLLVSKEKALVPHGYIRIGGIYNELHS